MELNIIEIDHHLSKYRIGSHRHNYFEVVYYISGKGFIEIENVKYPFSSNTFAVSKPNITHIEYSDNEVELIYVGFTLEKNENSDFLKNGIYSCAKEDHILLIMKEIYFEYQNKGFFYNEQIIHLLEMLMNLLKRTISKTQIKSSEMIKVRDYIRANCQTNLNAIKLAKIFNYNYDYFRKEFKKYFNISINEYIMSEQVNYATNLLRNTNMSIEEIAKKSGFSSTSHFINCFKKQYNVTPKKYIVKDLSI